MKEENRWITYWNKNDLMCVIEFESKIIWFVREVIFTQERISVIWNLWIDEKYRGEQLWLKLTSFLIQNINKNHIWLDCVPKLSLYYSKLWFEVVKNFPDWFLDTEELKKAVPMRLIKNKSMNSLIHYQNSNI